jgi:hypothetical protein
VEGARDAAGKEWWFEVEVKRKEQLRWRFDKALDRQRLARRKSCFIRVTGDTFERRPGARIEFDERGRVWAVHVGRRRGRGTS